ncbi:unnamed protein product [Chilo suppressalis]|uniref:Uncharacterized protein n=1 Tax=Chilo suppressalis TaxID=168631 RepID=A0ABN8AW22_CHISP|nr:unnamed protein product [Chilo suppressalis]
MLLIEILAFTFCFCQTLCAAEVGECRDHSNHVRRDGGMCFEIPPWQHLPVELDNHLISLKDKFGNSSTNTRRQIRPSQLALVNSQLSRYMDTVLAPFLDTYLRNIQNSYQQMTSKILRRIKDDVNGAVQKKSQIYKELIDLAQELKVPAMCDEERRQARTLASRHVAQIYRCTEEARASIAKMGKYAEEMIGITKNHMQNSLEDATKSLAVRVQRSTSSQENEVTECIKELSRAAVKLGYELDLSLTNARRHNEQSHEKLTACGNKAKRGTDDAVTDLKDQLYQCVYA